MSARAEIEDVMDLKEWLRFQIEHGHAPDGAPVEMDPTYAQGRRSAFAAVLNVIENRRVTLPPQS